MAPTSSNSGADAGRIAGGVLERKLDEWSRGIVAGADAGPILQRWLQLAIHTARADEATVWLQRPDETWMRLTLSLEGVDGPPQSAVVEVLPDPLPNCLQSEEPQWLRARRESEAIIRGVCAVRRSGRTEGVVDLVWSADFAEPSQAQLIPFLGVSAELLGDVLIQNELHVLRHEQQFWQRALQFVSAAQAVPSVAALAQLMVHDGRPLTGSERLSVVRRTAAAWRVIAVSGVDTIDPRSSTVQELERLADEAADWFTADAVPPTADQQARAYRGLQSVTQATAVIAIPLKTAAEDVDGVIVAEQFSTSDDRLRWERRCRHWELLVQSTWRNLVDAELGWLARWRRHRKFGRSRGSLLLTTLVVLAVVSLVLLLTPATLTVTAEGVLFPQQRRDVFAQTTGIVSEILIDHGARVSAGETLVVLRDPESDLESTRVAGELATIQARLQVVQAARVSLLTNSSESALQAQQLAAEEAELQLRQESLTAQQKLLQAERAALRVSSPLSGAVLTWDVSSLLLGRPVERGQILLTVGDVDGPWLIEARLRERDLSELPSTTDGTPPSIAVRFTPAAQSGQTYHGRVTEIANVAEVNERGETTVRVTIALDQPPEAALRPGTTVLPRLDCGRRSLGYVWLRELWHALRRQWWLWMP